MIAVRVQSAVADAANPESGSCRRQLVAISAVGRPDQCADKDHCACEGGNRMNFDQTWERADLLVRKGRICSAEAG